MKNQTRHVHTGEQRFWWWLAIVALVCLPSGLLAQEAPPDVEWPTYGADLASTRYRPLDQINGDNFNDLELAWRLSTQNFGPLPETNLQSTPLMIDGVVYTTAGSRRSAVAIDAATGELLWFYNLHEGERGEVAPRRLSGRGLAYWNGESTDRIFYVTPGYQLVALDAQTGLPVPNFGIDGVVDLKRELDQDIDLVTGPIGLHAAPVVAGNTIIIGAAHEVGSAPPTKENVKGYIRGYDVTTGQRQWIFHTLPQAGEFGNETWLNDSWQYTGNVGVWGQMTVDEELGLAYLPTEMPTGDYYGGHRHGDNLFADSLVAVDLDTGERRWHFQFVHHDVWDYDLPAAPILADITVDGRAIKAIVQPTKQNWAFVFDRETGEPVWPIEERPVPPSTVPGELLAPTQPFPTKPPAFDRQGITLDDLIDWTPELRSEAEALASRYQLGPIYTPPVATDPDGILGLLMVPQQTGGVNWPGGALDPETGIFYVYSKTEVSPLHLLNNPERSNMNYIVSRRVPGVPASLLTSRIQGLPMIKPPWGQISAVDLNKGEIVWQIPHGGTPDVVREHPALQHLDIPRTGWPGRIGTLVTKTLVIAGDSAVLTTESGERGAMLRAYAKDTGTELGQVYMPAPQTGSPMTYMLDGRQYIVIAVGSRDFPSELLAFRLPGA